MLRLAGVPWVGAVSEDYPGSLLDLRHRLPDTGLHEAERMGSLAVAAGFQLWGPPPERMEHRVLWAGTTGENFTGRVDPGRLELTADQVADSVDALLSRQARIPEPVPR